MIWDFGNGLGFWQWFRILATVWNFGNGLGFWQRFGIWDLGFGIWNFGKMLKLYFGICQIPNLFRNI
jgi:hypothetical protein